MKSITRYRGYDIVREGSEKPYQIFKDGKIASAAKYWDFGAARREVDWLKGHMG